MPKKPPDSGKDRPKKGKVKEDHDVFVKFIKILYLTLVDLDEIKVAMIDNERCYCVKVDPPVDYNISGGLKELLKELGSSL